MGTARTSPVALVAAVSLAFAAASADVRAEGERPRAAQPPVAPGEIFAVGVAGGPPRNLSRSPAHDGGAALSPDRRTVAFFSDRAGSPAVYAASVAGGPVRRVSPLLRMGESRNFGGLVWSLDGRRLAFHAAIPTGQAAQRTTTLVDLVFVVDVRTRTSRVLGEGILPRWSPDGRTVAYTRARSEDEGNAVVVAGRDGTKLWERPGTAPEWSPDGKLLAFAEPARVVFASPTGAIVSRRPGIFVAWAPDGKRTVVASADGATVHLATRHGRHTRKLTDGLVALAWSPDARALAFTGRRAERLATHVVRAPGWRPRRLPFTANPLEWSPDRRRILFAREPAAGRLRLLVAPAGGGRARKLLDGTATGWAGWTRDARAVVYEAPG